MFSQKDTIAARQTGAAPAKRWWRSRHRSVPILVTLVLGVCLSVTSWFVTARYWEDRLAATALGMVAENRVLAVTTAFDNQVKLVDDLRGYFGSRGGIPRRDEFVAVAAYLARNSQDPVSVTWVAHVRDPDRADFERQIRADQPGFEIRDRGPDGTVVAAARRPDYYPMLIAGGLNGTTAGLDLGADGGLLDTVRHASAEARTTATPTRPGGLNGGKVVSIVAPLFQRGPASNGVSGFILGTFDLGTVIDTVPHSVVAFHGVNTYLFDASNGDDAAPLYVRSSVLQTTPAPGQSRATLEAGLHWTGEVRIADSPLILVAVPVAGGPLDSWHTRAWIILLVLLLSTAVVCAALSRSALDAHKLEINLTGLRRRDAVLQAVAASGAELVGTLDFRQATATTLALIGRATGVDRVHLMRRALPADAAAGWHQQLWLAAQDATPSADSDPGGSELHGDVLQPVLGRQMQDGGIMVNAHREVGALRTAMDHAKIESMLVVPALLTQNMQCLLVFIHCSRSEQPWSATETSLLRVVADLLGGALARDSALAQLADADHIIENSPVMLFRAAATPGWPLVYLSENVSRYGYSAVELCATGRKFDEFIHPDDLPAVHAGFARAIDTGQSTVEFVCRERTADHNYRWFETKVTVHRDPTDQIATISGIMLDVTDRKHAEDALAFSHVLLTAALENSTDGMLITDENDRIIANNQRFVALWNIPQELVGSSGHDEAIAAGAALLQDPRRFITRVQYLFAHRDERSQDELEFKDGRIFERATAPLFGPVGRYLGRIWFFRDITERKLAEKTLAFSNTLLTAAMNSSPYGMLVIGPQSRIISFNDRFVELLKVPPQLVNVGDNEPVLAHVTALVKDSDKFLQRVRYIYEHPDEPARDQFELKDGRILDRHTAPLYDNRHQYLGLICFFRDIGEPGHSDQERLAASARADALANRVTNAQAVDQAREARRDRLKPPATAA
jgi:PAS domain S-box-containing protein